MTRKIRWITKTAAMLALLVVFQAVTKGFGQLVTGSAVNTILAVTAMVVGMSSGICVAVLSPVLAYLLGIAPQLVTVPAIMVGNAVYVFLLALIAGKGSNFAARILGWLLAAAAKFAVLYLLVGKIICGLASAPLLSAGLLKPPMLEKLPGMFSIPQLITALIGGAIALLIFPLLSKASKSH